MQTTRRRESLGACTRQMPTDAELAFRCRQSLLSAHCVPRFLHRAPPNAMNSQQALKRLAQQLERARQNASGGNNRFPGGKGFTAGGGLLVALIAGGFALNASLFNGEHHASAQVDLADTQRTVDGGHRAIKYTR